MLVLWWLTLLNDYCRKERLTRECCSLVDTADEPSFIHSSLVFCKTRNHCFDTRTTIFTLKYSSVSQIISFRRLCSILMKILHGFRQFIFEYTSVPSLLGGIRLYDCVKVILLEKHFLTRLCHKGRIRSYWLETKTQNLGHMLALKVHVQIIFWINEKSFLIILPPTPTSAVAD